MQRTLNRDLLNLVEDLQEQFAAFAQWASIAGEITWDEVGGMVRYPNGIWAIRAMPKEEAEKIRLGLERLREEL